MKFFNYFLLLISAFFLSTLGCKTNCTATCGSIKDKMTSVVQQCHYVQHGPGIDIEVNLNGFLNAFLDLNLEIGSFFGILSEPEEVMDMFGHLVSFQKDMNDCFAYISGLHVDVDLLGIDLEVDVNLDFLSGIFINLWGFVNVWIGSFTKIIPIGWMPKFLPIFGEFTQMVQETCSIFGPFCP